MWVRVRAAAQARLQNHKSCGQTRTGLSLAELARNALHGVGAAARDQGDGVSVVDGLHRVANRAHRVYKRLTHEVHGTVSVHHTKLSEVALALAGPAYVALALPLLGA